MIRSYSRMLGLLWLLLIGFYGQASAQPWAGILDTSRAIDWSASGVIGGIPTNRTQCGSTIAAYTGTAATINNAIAACGANQYVKLGTGTFNLSTGIDFAGTSNVTLKGSGPLSTILKFTGNAGCIWTGYICVSSNSNIYGGTPDARSWETSWTAGYAKGTTQLTVGSTANMLAGMVVVLDQLEETTDGGGIVNSSVYPTFAQENTGRPGRHDTADSPLYRMQHQIVKVVSVDDATHVTITPGLYLPNWRSGQSPEVWSWGTTVNATVFNDGVEDLTVDGYGDASFYYNIAFTNAYNCWAKNVRSIHSRRGHFGMSQAAQIEIRDSMIYDSQTHQSTSYGFENFITSSNLYINNISDYVSTPFVGPCAGCVVAYNYARNAWIFRETWNGFAIVPTHDAGGGMSLFEGNQTNSTVADPTHGNSPLMTFFRNFLNGFDDTGTRTENLYTVLLRPFARGYNFVGNVLGRSGTHTNYEITPSGGSGWSIFTVGIGTAGMANDAVTLNSLLRWGNYDVVNGVSRFVAAEIPTTGIQYLNGNPVPASQTLPASFFLASQPTAWWATPWGTPAWPPIGPDVTGGDVTGYNGHAYTIPAKLCYTHLADDPAYAAGTVKLFDANACYQAMSGSPYLLITTDPAICTGGTACTTQPVVTVKNVDGTTDTGSAAPILLSIASGPAGATLTATANPLNATAGVASFSGFTLDKAGTYTIRACSAGLVCDDSAAFDVTVGAATKLLFIVQPVNGEAGTALTQQPSVGSYDAGGNLVTTATDSVTLTLNTCTGLQAMTNPLTETNGVSQFAGVKVTNAGTGCTLTASATGRTSATSVTFDISATPEVSVKGAPTGGGGGSGL